MSDSLGDLEVLALDCQATGASPAHGDLLELGWARCGPSGLVGPVRSHWIVPRTVRPVRRAVRELTGWTEACLAEALDESAAWSALVDDAERVAEPGRQRGAPTVIHFARFELPFLRDLHERMGRGGELPFDAICLHAIAARLFPDLPRRNIRALAGYLGHSPGLIRRSAGHVEATAFIWHALLPSLEALGVATWNDLKTWLEQPRTSVRPERRVYPLPLARRRALPDAPGVYRFLRRSGDVLYVGKATSLRKRVASHFKSRGPVTERALELLTQVHDIEHSETASLLEAAMLETDEIKRLDPPYNVQLRSGDRCAWFASRDGQSMVPAPDAAHPVGPLPSSGALTPLSALIRLVDGSEASPGLRAQVLAVPTAFLPDESLFLEGWRTFFTEHFSRADRDAVRRVHRASLALWLERGRTELESTLEESAPDAWDIARVRRRLERSLVQTGLLARRARLLCLLSDGVIAFHERGRARCLAFSHGELVERSDALDVRSIAALPVRRPPSLHERKCSFDAAVYDRMRVLSTELRRGLDEGGEVSLRVGSHTFAGERIVRLLRGI